MGQKIFWEIVFRDFVIAPREDDFPIENFFYKWTSAVSFGFIFSFFLVKR